MKKFLIIVAACVIAWLGWLLYEKNSSLVDAPGEVAENVTSTEKDVPVSAGSVTLGQLSFSKEPVPLDGEQVDISIGMGSVGRASCDLYLDGARIAYLDAGKNKTFYRQGHVFCADVAKLAPQGCDTEIRPGTHEVYVECLPDGPDKVRSEVRTVDFRE